MTSSYEQAWRDGVEKVKQAGEKLGEYREEVESALAMQPGEVQKHVLELVMQAVNEESEGVLDLVKNMKQKEQEVLARLQREAAEKELERDHLLEEERQRLRREAAVQEKARDEELREALVGVATLRKAVFDSRKARIAKDRQAYRKEINDKAKEAIKVEIEKRSALLNKRYQEEEERQKQKHAAVAANMLEEKKKQQEFARSELDLKRNKYEERERQAAALVYNVQDVLAGSQKEAGIKLQRSLNWEKHLVKQKEDEIVGLKAELAELRPQVEDLKNEARACKVGEDNAIELFNDERKRREVMGAMKDWTLTLRDEVVDGLEEKLAEAFPNGPLARRRGALVVAAQDYGEQEFGDDESDLFGPQQPVPEREQEDEVEAEEDENEEEDERRTATPSDSLPLWSSSNSDDDDRDNDAGADGGAFMHGALFSDEGSGDFENHQEHDQDDQEMDEHEDAHLLDLEGLQDWLEREPVPEVYEPQEQLADFGDVAEDLKEVLETVRFPSGFDTRVFAGEVKSAGLQGRKNKKARMPWGWRERFQWADDHAGDQYCFLGKLASSKAGYKVSGSGTRADCPSHRGKKGGFCVQLVALDNEDKEWELRER